MENGEKKWFKPTTDFDEPIKKETPKEPKITKKLAIELDRKDAEDEDKLDLISMREKIKGLTDVKGRIDAIFAKEDLTPEMQLKIEECMKGLKETYEKIVKISVRHISNAEKAKKIQEELGKTNLKVIESIDIEIKKTETIMDKLAKERAEEDERIYESVKEMMKAAADKNIAAAKERDEEARIAFKKAKSKTDELLPVPKEKSIGRRIMEAIKDNPKEWKPELYPEKDEIHWMHEGEIKYITKNAAKKDIKAIKREEKKVNGLGVAKRVMMAIQKYKEEEKVIVVKREEELTERQNRIEIIRKEKDKCAEQVNESTKSKEELENIFDENKKSVRVKLKGKLEDIKFRPITPRVFSFMLDKMMERDKILIEQGIKQNYEFQDVRTHGPISFGPHNMEELIQNDTLDKVGFRDKDTDESSGKTSGNSKTARKNTFRVSSFEDRD